MPSADASVPPDLPRPSVWTRLHFAWALAWAALVTPWLGFGVILHSLFRPTARVFKAWVTAWARLLLAGAGVRVVSEVRAEMAPGQPAVFIANHQNELDILTCAAGIPFPFGFMAKAELRNVPVIGAVIGRTACLFVDRSQPRLAAESLREAAQRIRGGNSVLIYVEGARSWSPRLLPFLKGAFVLAVEAGVPLVPVTQLDNYRVLDERRFASRPGTVHLVVHEPIPTAGLRRSAVPELMDRVREVMEAELTRFHGAGPLLGEPAGRPAVSSAPAGPDRPGIA